MRHWGCLLADGACLWVAFWSSSERSNQKYQTVECCALCLGQIWNWFLFWISQFCRLNYDLFWTLWLLVLIKDLGSNLLSILLYYTAKILHHHQALRVQSHSEIVQWVAPNIVPPFCRGLANKRISKITIALTSWIENKQKRHQNGNDVDEQCAQWCKAATRSFVMLFVIWSK
jgi:hypothetical protein